MKRLFIDLETTGVDPHNNSIIEIAAILVEDGKILSQFEEKCFDPLPKKVDLGALKVNKVKPSTIRESLTKETPYKSAAVVVESLAEWLLEKLDYGERVEIAGQNPHFDSAFLKATFERYGYTGWSSIFSHRLLDTNSIVQPLIEVGILDLKDIPKTGGSLQRIATALNIKFNEDKLHTAMEDAKLSMEVYFSVVRLLKELNK